MCVLLLLLLLNQPCVQRKKFSYIKFLKLCLKAVKAEALLFEQTCRVFQTSVTVCSNLGL